MKLLQDERTASLACSLKDKGSLVKDSLSEVKKVIAFRMEQLLSIKDFIPCGKKGLVLRTQDYFWFCIPFYTATRCRNELNFL